MNYKKPQAVDRIISKILEYLLCAYIIVVPIINSIEFWIFGYGIQVYLSILIIAFSLIIRFLPSNKRNNTYFSLVILIVFLLEILLQLFRGDEFEITTLLLVSLYISFLALPDTISLKSIYFSYYIALIIAAIYSIVIGYTEQGITRTATSVDGSLGIIGIAFSLFAKENFDYGKVYKTLKITSFFSSAVILGFGMSRSRIFLAVLLLLIKLAIIFVSTLASGRIKIVYIIAIPFLIILLFSVSRLEVVRSLFEEITGRFDSGFASQGRNDEIEFGWSLFKQNIFFGVGYGEHYFIDYQNYESRYHNHCMYVALLARGGIALAVPFLLSFVSVIKDVLTSKKLFLIMLLICFFALGYGNAGIFNYTIVSFMIPIVLGLRESSPEETGAGNGRNIYSQRKS